MTCAGNGISLSIDIWSRGPSNTVLLPICCRVLLYLQQLARVPVHIHPKGGQRGIVDGIKCPVAVAVHLQYPGAS